MARRKVPRFIIGLFVTVGVFMAVAVIIWISASKFFEKGDHYVSYFDESVQGLQQDSLVKYRGVDVGRIEAISVAPDNVLIQVKMKIGVKEDWANKTVAQLKPVGITGITFIDLGPRKAGEPNLSPKLSFAPEYPVIPSRPSDINNLISGVSEVVAEIKEVDLKKATDRIQAAAAAAENLMTRPETNRILANLDSAAAHLDAAVKRVDRITGEGKLEAAFSDTRQILAESRDAVKKLKEEIKSMKIAEASQKMNRLIDGVDRKSRMVADQMAATGENLQRATESLEALMDRLKANPSDILFSSPSPPGRGE